MTKNKSYIVTAAVLAFAMSISAQASMIIAQVAPLYESVPPQKYGGTERIVSYLTEELVNQGHDVTLFAAGDSQTKANLVPMTERSLRTDPNSQAPLAHHINMLEKVAQMAGDFDVIHFHIDYLHFPMSRILRLHQLTTLHGRLDLPDLVPLFSEFKDMPLVSISDNQRLPLMHVDWAATVHHGLPKDLYNFHGHPDDYLAFIGRISPEKGVDRAIKIAIQSGMKLKIAAKVDAVDKDYFEKEIRPLMNNPLIEFIGEIDDHQKNEFIGNAKALLFPINWPEPFGLVMIESMACGTPVIAFNNGSVPEVMEDGVTGYIVKDCASALKAVQNIDKIDRLQCRKTFEQRFTATRMAKDYVRIYKEIVDGERGEDQQKQLIRAANGRAMNGHGLGPASQPEFVSPK